MSLRSQLSDVLGPAGWHRPTSTSMAALITAAVLMPLGILFVRSRSLNPLSSQGVASGVAYAFVLLVILALLALVLRREWVAGVAAGAVAAWSSACVALALVGTPYGYGSMRGDAGRMSALATYFATTMRPSDSSDPGLPVEYPPLYPMVTGRIAAITGTQAWLLLGPMQSFLVGFGVLCGFLAWRRLVPAVLAIPLALTAWAGLAEPSKANEILGLTLFVPVLLMTFTSTGGRRPLHALLAGGLIGLLVTLYPNYYILGSIGIAGLMTLGWLRTADRTRYAVHAAVVVVTAWIVASWYLVPLLISYASGNPEVVADLFRAAALTNSQFVLFLSKSNYINVLQVIGLAGIVLLWKRAWWAAPMGMLAAGIVVVKAAMLWRYTGGPGHSFMLLYTPYVTSALFAAVGLLTLAEAARAVWPLLHDRLAVPRQLALVTGVAVLVGVFAAPTYMTAWMPLPRGVVDTNGRPARPTPVSLAAYAHAEYTPNGAKPKYPWPVMSDAFPADRAIAAIDQTATTKHPVVLSADQRLFSFAWYPNWLPPGKTSSNALTRWDSRFAVLKLITTQKTSAGLADALAHTPYGPVDVLVLREARDGSFDAGHRLKFSSEALLGGSFKVTRGLPGGWAVFARR